MKMFKKTYTKKEILFRLALDIFECKCEVNEVFKQYLYQREKEKQENSRPSSNKIPNHWIHIAPENVGNMQLQKFNEGASRMPKHQECALGN